MAALRPDVEMVAGVLLQTSNPTVDSAGVVADGRTLMASTTCTETGERSRDAPAPLGPTGGAALYRRAPSTVGGFDERIFAYYEDLDLALRLRRGRPLRPRPRRWRAMHGTRRRCGSRRAPSTR